jgi:hypothetical protein
MIDPKMTCTDVLPSDHDPMCCHCSVADAINEFRHGQGAQDFLETRRLEQKALGITDRQALRQAIMFALGSVYADTILEAPEDAEPMSAQFSSAASAVLQKREPRRGGC